MDLPHIAVARLIGRGSNCLQHSISYLTPNQLSLLTQSQYHLAANFSCHFQIIFTPVFIDNNLEFWWGTFANTDINFYNFTQSKIVRILFVILIRFERLCSNPRLAGGWMLESLETSSYSKVISLIIRRNIVVPPAAASQHPAQGYLWVLQTELETWNPGTS